MTEQTKAQRLADRLEDESGGVLLGFIPGQPVQEKELDCNFEAAAELRRLDALNAELVGVLQKMDAACAAIPEEIEGYLEQLNDALVDVRAALAKAKEQT